MIALFTIFELEQLTDTQLEELYATLNRLLTASAAGSAERRNILASLENLTLVRNRRHAAAPSL